MHDRTLLAAATRLERMAEGDRPTAVRAALLDTAETIRRVVLEMAREAALAAAQAGPATPEPPAPLAAQIAEYFATDDGRSSLARAVEATAQRAAREELQALLRLLTDREF